MVGCVFYQERKIVPTLAFASIFVITVCSFAATASFYIFNCHKVSPYIFYMLVGGSACCLIFLAALVYCTIAYRKPHRVFITVCVAIGALGCGFLSFCVFSHADKVYDYIGQLWGLEDLKSAEVIEEWFACKDWGTEDSETCASVVKKFLDDNARTVAIILGVLFIIFLVGLFFSLYIVCNTGKIGDWPPPEQDDDVDEQNDMGIELNPEGGLEDV